MTSNAFPLALVRAQFPALNEPQHRDMVFLDNPAGSQVAGRAIAAMNDALIGAFANSGGAFATALRFEETVAHARARAALFVNAGSAEEIAFAASMTAHTYHVARAIGRTLAPGDEVIVTTMDHEANISPWLRAAEDFGLTVRWLAFDAESWRIEPTALEQVLGPRTRVLALNHASNLTGSLNDVTALCAMCRDAGVLSYVDGVQSAPHVLPDVATLGCDFFVCSAYKFFGPHVSVLWGRREVLERLPADRLRCGPSEPAEKFEWGSSTVETLAGLAGAIEHFLWLGETLGSQGDERERLAAAFAGAQAHEQTLVTALIDGLSAIDGTCVQGITSSNELANRVPTVSFTCEGRSSRAIAEGLAARGINAWSGHNYAYAVAQQLGLDLDDGVVRLGIAHYNGADEIARTLEAIAALAHGR